jgi:mannose-6-phosphate isomerase-like protein (cupin superfamily)
MDVDDVGGLVESVPDDAVGYREFVRERSLSVGLYTLPAGSDDPQDPHTEDEVYHVLEGRARLRVGSETARVGPGSVVFVPRGTDHEFLDVEETLRTLVFFAPAEGTNAD